MILRSITRLFLLTLVLGMILPLNAQVTQITHFVAPQYPPLARQTTISGQVVLKATIDTMGKVMKLVADSSVHPLLTESATAAVKEWQFSPGDSKKVVTAVFIYGFSGKTRDTNPVTVVRADFEALAVRVYVTTDSYPMSQATDQDGRRE